ncbi:BON domain protein [Roseovarius litorisediminis]|uniref:BON domain protein n=1 Tax=Roseovarius litorisediminis TaxID=1312363 RepID=A0A1Y5R878_9RHOB|nr:hypothetical protein [Roseovarius litorisediminis]SLN10739.1 BON domain protein [Roseovarius litorisediminis]
MEDFLGAVFLIAALFAFGMFNFQKDEPLVEAGLRSQAEAIVGPAIHPLSVEVNGRSISVSGVADTEAEREFILTNLREIEGRGRISSALTVLEPAVPYALHITYQKGQATEIEGPVPTERQRAALRGVLGDRVEALTLASGAPDLEWGGVALRGAQALVMLENGRLEMDGRMVRLNGTALTPEVDAKIGRIFTELPGGYGFEKNLTLLDDGSPLRLSVTKMPDGTLKMSGKLPQALELAAIDQRLSEQNLPITPIAVPFDGWSDALATGLKALDQLQSGNMTLIGSSFTLSGEAWSETAYEQAHALVDQLPGAIKATTDIAQMDDGAAFALTITFDGVAAVARGKAPADLGLRVQSAFLDHPVTGPDLVIAQVRAGKRWWQAATAGIEALKELEHGAVTFSDDELTFTGLVFDSARQEKMAAQLAAVLPDGVETRFDLDYYDDGTPFRLSLEFDGRDAIAKGKVPAALPISAQSGLLGGPVSPGGLVDGKLEAPSDWLAAARLGIGALALFENGVLQVSDNRLRLEGLLRDPNVETQMQDLLAGLPDGFDAETELEFLDDGRPFWLTLTTDANGARASGKVPYDLGLQSQSVIFGRVIEAGDLNYADVPASPEWWNAARTGIKALSMLETGTVTIEPGGLILSGTALDATRREAVERRLGFLPEGFDVSATIDLSGD